MVLQDWLQCCQKLQGGCPILCKDAPAEKMSFHRTVKFSKECRLQRLARAWHPNFTILGSYHVGSNYCWFSSVVDPVRSFTSISWSEILDLFPSDLISLTLNTRVNVHWYVWVSLLSWSFTESSGGVQLTSTPSRSVTSCSLQKKGTQEMIEVMSWYKSWICMQIILVLIPPR